MNIKGTDESEALIGTDAGEKIIGFAGNDTIDGGDGNDRLYGGAGADVIIGGAGDDVIFAGNGGQRSGDGAADVMEFGTDDGFDKIYGFEVGSDQIVLTGTDTDYTITFVENTQNTIITYGDTTITVYDVRLTEDDISTPNSDLGGGGIGGDQVDDPITEPPLEDTLGGTDGDDTIAGQDGGNLLRGSDGNDYILGNTGRDTIFGGVGDDTLYGGQQDDFISGWRGNDILSGDAGSDRMRGGPGTDTFAFFARHDGDGSDLIVDWEPGEELAFIGYTGVSIGLSSGIDSVILTNPNTGHVIAEIEGTTAILSVWLDIAYYTDNPF